MRKFNRRTFVQLSTGALVAAASSHLHGETKISTTTHGEFTTTEVKGPNYLWQYSQSSDTFRLFDQSKRLIVEGKMQPAVTVAPADKPDQRISTPDRPHSTRTETDRLTIEYTGVNGSARLTLVWRFNANGIWLDPIQYETTATEDIVSLHYFTDNSPLRHPALHSSYLVVPGITSASTLSPILKDTIHLEDNVWLGRGGPGPGLFQQWALPVHYFCGFSKSETGGTRSEFTEGRSDSFTCGLADLPSGDLYLQLHAGNASPWVDYRSDLWKHLRGPGKITLGATLLFSVAPDYYESIATYYQGMLQAGIIHRKQNSAHKTAVALTPQFCSWGAQLTRNKTGDKLDEAFLSELYRDFKSSGMKAGLFSIDDKWEGSYGTLQHSEERLPHFEQFLDQLRADGLRIGMWAAIMRCEKPSEIGLTLDHMLKRPDGQPYYNQRYFLLDFTQPEVAQVLGDLVRKFMRRYKPDVFKFDFGYELPTVAVASPADKQWTGERLMAKGLDVVIRTMKEENPDLVVMYYNLSPLFLEYFDQHSPDDLFVDAGDYEVEANRRGYFSSLMGKLGVPTYGSSGYDWASSPSIWFDSAAIGTIGSICDFAGDEEGARITPEIAAKYNGIAQLLRPTTTFEIVPIGTISQSPTLGAHARSWERYEEDELVLLAQRPPLVGEENPLLKGYDPRVKKILQASFPVVVASKNSECISHSTRLALVPYLAPNTTGEISLRRLQGKHAHVVSHYFGGQTAESTATITGGWLKLTVHDKNATAKPLEWIELIIT